MKQITHTPKLILHNALIENIVRAIVKTNQYNHRNSKARLIHNPGLLKKAGWRYTTYGTDEYVIFRTDDEGTRALQNLVRTRIRLEDSLEQLAQRLNEDKKEHYVKVIQKQLHEHCNLRVSPNTILKYVTYSDV